MATNSQPNANGAATPENSMHELAAAIVTAMRQPKQLSATQQRVELKFRLIRNGLGNFGGHGDDPGDRALIRMTQTRANKDGGCELELLDPLPARARVVLITPEHRGGVERVRIGQKHHDPIEVGFSPIARVDILDDFDVPIAAGIPALAATTSQQAVAQSAR
jgi:hypothetical protein